MQPLVLLKPHTHAGRAFAAGACLEVDAPTFEWLLAQGIARTEVPPQKSASGTEPTAVNPSHPSKLLKESKP